MTLPTFDQFIAHLLRHMASRPDGAPIGEVVEGAATLAGLTEEDRGEITKSGGSLPTYWARIEWAHDRLKNAGLSSTPRRGIWKLTPEGMALARRSAKLDKAEVERITQVLPDVRLREMPVASQAGTATGMVESPNDRIEAAVHELRSSVARDLLENIARASTGFFDKLIYELLLAMGYAASRADLQRTGGAADGIEGIVSFDRLGLARVFVQAKRWQAPAGAPQIQAFLRALELQGASRGVLITSGTVGRDALAAAERTNGAVVIIDGLRLTELMIEYGVGVTPRHIVIPRIDADYFDG